MTLYSGDMPDELRRILLAFALHDPAVGYCQGMNLLAAMALLVMAGDETAAFWSLTTIIQRVIPGYHSEGLELLRLDIRVVASMLEQRDPALLMHLTTLGVFDVVVTKCSGCPRRRLVLLCLL